VNELVSTIPRRLHLLRLITLLACWIFTSPVLWADTLGRVPSGLELHNLAGEKIKPLSGPQNGSGIAVLVFITTDCPIANRYAPELKRLHSEFQTRGVQMTLVHVDKELSQLKAKQHAADYDLPRSIVIDRKHQLVTATGASITPEAVVIDQKGHIRYRGRINDQHTDFGKRRRQPTRHDLQNAVQSLLNGQPIAEPQTKAIGCVIPGHSPAPPKF
jgi:peroxiredoxin